MQRVSSQLEGNWILMIRPDLNLALTGPTTIFATAWNSVLLTVAKA